MTGKTKAQPTTAGAWEEYVNGLDSAEKFAAAFNDGSFKDKLSGYVAAKNDERDDLLEQVKNQTEATVTEMLKRHPGAKVGRVDQAQNRATASAAPGRVVDGIFTDLGQFFQDMLSDHRKNPSAERAQRFQNYSEKNPSEGGFLVPEEFRSDILAVALESAVVRPRAHVVPMSSLTLRYPALDFTTEVGEVYGGMVMHWMDEGEEIPATDASFAALKLVLHKLAGLASLPNELVKDAPALTAWLRQAMPAAIRDFEDRAFMKGNGIAKPLGGLHADNPALIAVAKETSQAIGTINWANVLKMFSRLLPESYPNAVWVASPDTIPQLFGMTIPVKNVAGTENVGGAPVMVAPGGGPNQPALTMLGLPIVFSRKAPAVLGTQGDLSLVDWSKYVIGDGGSIELDTSEHSSFKSDKTDFRVIERVDGQPGLLAPLTPENGGPTLSAFVQLADRTS
jgi:HK97 family phage major capsid protein